MVQLYKFTNDTELTEHVEFSQYLKMYKMFLKILKPFSCPGCLAEPCIPDHVQAEYSTSVALVSWDPSDGADSYTVTAQSSQGELSSCNTTGTSCTVTDLHCGLDYNISITSCNDVCNDTAISAVIELETGKPSRCAFLPCTDRMANNSRKR